MADRPHILIVEDDPLIVDVLVASLELEYRVSSVNTVGAALAFLRTSHVDVVLIDSVLPDGRGTEVACFAGGIGAAVIEMSGYPQVMDHLEHSAAPASAQAIWNAGTPFDNRTCSSECQWFRYGNNMAYRRCNQPRRDIMTYRRMPALVVTLGVPLRAAWCTLLAYARHAADVRLARCSISTARCWMSAAVSSFQRTSPPSPWRTRSDMPPRFSAPATCPHRRDACMHLKSGPTPAGCSLRR